VYCKKIASIRTKLTEEIHFEVCPYRHNAQYGRDTPVQCYAPAASTTCSLQAPTRCDVPVAQRTTPFAVRYDIGALQRGTFKNSTLGVFIYSEWSAFGNSGSGHVRSSDWSSVHDVRRRAYRTGGIRTWGRNRAVKTSRLVVLLTRLYKWQIQQLALVLVRKSVAKLYMPCRPIAYQLRKTDEVLPVGLCVTGVHTCFRISPTAYAGWLRELEIVVLNKQLFCRRWRWGDVDEENLSACAIALPSTLVQQQCKIYKLQHCLECNAQV